MYTIAHNDFIKMVLIVTISISDYPAVFILLKSFADY